MNEEAVQRGLSMWEEGATWVDVGGESTRPGAKPVDREEELERVLPVIRGLRAAQPKGFISIDTRHAEVARAAIEAGADMVNDVSGLRDPQMMDVVVETGCAVCVMHMQGEPGTMQVNPVYHDVVEEVRACLLLPQCLVLDVAHDVEEATSRQERLRVRHRALRRHRIFFPRRGERVLFILFCVPTHGHTEANYLACVTNSGP